MIDGLQISLTFRNGKEVTRCDRFMPLAEVQQAKHLDLYVSLVVQRILEEIKIERGVL